MRTRLSERLVKELGGRVASIILYGSAARGGAYEESDLDMLIINMEDDGEAYEKSSPIRTGIDLANRTFTSLLVLSRREFNEYLSRGSSSLAFQAIGSSQSGRDVSAGVQNA